MALQYPEHIGLQVEGLPLVESDVFVRNPNAAYHVGVYAVGSEVMDEAAFLAARQLRFQRYNELGWIPDIAQDLDGGEHDKHDQHSAQFGVIKNTKTGPRMIATSRLIRKTSEGVLLPVEEDFPEAFTTDPVRVGDVEVSRLISESKIPRERHAANLAIQRAMIGWGNENGHRYAHAMVEPYLTKLFDEVSVPYRERSDPKQIAEYGNSINAAITIDSKAMIESMKAHRTGVPITTSMFFHNITRNLGLGFYGKRFIRRYK